MTKNDCFLTAMSIIPLYHEQRCQLHRCPRYSCVNVNALPRTAMSLTQLSFGTGN
jgi:hypothetical protein